MAALVADYGSSSDSEDPENEEKCETKCSVKDDKEEKTPLPSFSNNLLTSSVFSNPFRQAEDAKTALLEKHVKLTQNTTKMSVINGKKVCWMYRKGRCRFGHKCQLAHDSDLIVGENSERQTDQPYNGTSTVVDLGNVDMFLHDPRPYSEEEQPPMKKRRPGLSRNLVPGKKVIEMYEKTRTGPPV